jgi:hypothetical protein
LALNIGESSPDLPTFTCALIEALSQIESWADKKNLKIAPDKSSITLYTPDPHQGKFHPQVIPLNKYPKILGITWDTLLCFNHHIDDIVARASRCLQILKTLCMDHLGAL